MPALYEASASEFLRAEENLIIGHLAGLTRLGISELSAKQLEAWHSQVPILRRALSHESAQSSHLLLEFPIPRRGKRIDALLLIRDLILVLEFKCGESEYRRDGFAQVEDYCLDLRDFHKESRGRTIVPVLIATAAEAAGHPEDLPFDFVAPVWRANAISLGDVLEQVTTRYASADSAIDPGIWNGSEYLPTPTILEAARLLYEGQNVREVSRCHAGAENLTKTSDAVAEAI